MPNPDSPRDESLPLSQLERVHQVCVEFESAWQSGGNPRAEGFLSDVSGNLRLHLLRELLLLELEYRGAQGDHADSPELRQRFPDEEDLIQEILATIEAVQHRPDKPEPGGRANRFPVRLNCPHCQNPIAIVDDGNTEEIECPSCGSSFQLDPDRTVSWSPDKLPEIDKFQLLEAVGRGAFGTVYRAKDTELDRIVAVKVPRSGSFDSEDDEQRFLREARNAAQLTHPGIVPVYAVGRSELCPYIVSEFVQGVTLADVLTARRFGARDAAGLVLSLAEALDHAHQKGVIHRDLKPSNIMLESVDTGLSTGSDTGSTSATGSSVIFGSSSGSSSRSDRPDYRPRIMDFGLARRDSAEVTMTIEGQILGTPAYMSPEQARGEGHQADSRSDIYSLGVILFELLTGARPFRGNSRMLIHQVLNDEPPSPRKLNASIPSDLDTICLKCLEKDSARRYQASTDFAADLDCWLTGHPIQARPVGRIERGWRWCKRNPTISRLSAVVMLSLLAGIVISARFAIEASLETDFARDETERADGKAAAATASADKARLNLKLAERNAYNSDMLLVQRDWQEANISHIREILTRYRERDDLRGFEWYYWNRVVHSNLLTLQGHTQGVTSVAFSSDGLRLASASLDRTVRVWDPATGQVSLTLKGHTGSISSVAFSPDGLRLASASYDKTVKVWDAATGQKTATLKGHMNQVNSVAFSPDGAQVATASHDKTVKLWNAATGKETLTLKGHNNWVQCVAFSPDGKWLASASSDKTVRVWDAATGQKSLTLKGHTSGVYGVAFTPNDGKRLATASADQTVKLWDAATGQESLTLKGHTGLVWSVAFSPDGQRLASASLDRTAKVWDAATGQESLTLKGHTFGITSATFRPDGQRLATASLDLTVNLWDATSEQESLRLEGHTEGVRNVAFSPGGRRMASSGSYGDNTVKVWDTATGQESLTLRGHTHVVHSVAFSPEGQRLASASADKTVKMWDTATGQESLTLRGHTSFVRSVAFSLDGQRLASASNDKTVRVWDAATGQELLTLNGHTSDVRSVAFSLDGQWLATASWDKTVRVWDAATGQESLTLKGHTAPIMSVAFSRDGQRLASASHDKTVKVWDAATGEELLTLKGHADTVESVVFSPDGKRLASASNDKTVKVWDAATGRESLTLNGHSRQVTSVAFYPDGQRLASASYDKTVKVWDARPWTPELRAESQARGYLTVHRNRVKSREQLQTYIRSDKTISDMVRKQALDWSELFWKNHQPPQN